MSSITWKFSSHVDRETVVKVARDNGFSLPEDLIMLIMEGNNGIPSVKHFDSVGAKEHLIKTLLSYNSADIENVYGAIDVLKESKFRLYPIANDPAGNLLCLSPQGIVLWNHENDTIDKVANSVSDFLNQLY